jgi:hypothetical protein
VLFLTVILVFTRPNRVIVTVASGVTMADLLITVPMTVSPAINVQDGGEATSIWSDGLPVFFVRGIFCSEKQGKDSFR